MIRLSACLSVLAAIVATPVVARTAEIPAIATAPAGNEAYRAAVVAASYGSVTSIYRSVAHNRAVGGVVNSYHLQGRAIDIARRPGVTHAQITAALLRAGYRMIESLDEGDHSHFAFASSSATPMQVAALPALPAVPEAPKPPKYPAILADEHGTLQIDLPAAAVGSDR